MSPLSVVSGVSLFSAAGVTSFSSSLAGASFDGFSSLDLLSLLSGRVFWFKASRSMFPIILTPVFCLSSSFSSGFVVSGFALSGFSATGAGFSFAGSGFFSTAGSAFAFSFSFSGAGWVTLGCSGTAFFVAVSFTGIPARFRHCLNHLPQQVSGPCPQSK
jgi:hypothetical protein